MFQQKYGDEFLKKIKRDRVTGWKRRLNDTGWGWPIAHLIPFIPIYYFLTRQTITPFLYIAGLGIIHSILFILLFSDSNVKVLLLVEIALVPIVAKIGINSARNRAKNMLKRIDAISTKVPE